LCLSSETDKYERVSKFVMDEINKL
jgi:hypothetical protein